MLLQVVRKLNQAVAAGQPLSVNAAKEFGEVCAKFEGARASLPGGMVSCWQLVGSLLELLHEHVLISIASLEAESHDVRQLRRQHTRLFERITAHDAPGAAQAARAHIAFVRRSWQQRLA